MHDLYITFDGPKSIPVAGSVDLIWKKRPGHKFSRQVIIANMSFEEKVNEDTQQGNHKR